MKPSLQCFSLFLFINLLAACNGVGVRLNYDDDSDNEDNQDHAVIYSLGHRVINEIKKHECQRSNIVNRAWISSGKGFITSGGLSIKISGRITSHSLRSPKERFFLAASEGKVRQVENILDDRDVDINTKDENGDTALIIAAREGLKYARKGKGKNTQIAEALLDNGAKEYLIRNHIKKGLKSALPGAAKAGATAALAL